MKILFTPFQNLNKASQKTAPVSNLQYKYGLTQDTVSFGAIKKSQLDKHQLLCANYFKAPLEKFKTNDEFKEWAKNELTKTIDPQKYPIYYDFRPFDLNELDTSERVKRLEQWQGYLLGDKGMKEHPELALFIADSITRDLYPETKNFPPVFDLSSLKDTIQDINNILKSNPRASINFRKKYLDVCRTNVLETAQIIKDKTPKSKGYWVRIPSLSNDPQNFEDNIKAINIISTESWCTKGHFARKYMKEGDFYIYMEGKSPELSVRLEGDEIKEVRDRNHNSKIPLSYYRSLSNLIKENDFKGYNLELQELESRKMQVDLTKSIMQDDIDNKNYANILKAHGIEVSVREDGLLELSNFKKAHKEYTYQDLGINENEMFRHIGSIKGSADFADTQVTNLGKLESIDGCVYLNCSKLNDLGKVKTSQRVFRD